MHVGRGSKVNYRQIKVRQGGSIKIGSHSMCDAILSCGKSGASINIGDRTFVGSSTITSASNVTIGSDVLISSGCYITDSDGHSIDHSVRKHDVAAWMQKSKDWHSIEIKPTTVDDHSWIGWGSIILKGVHIGKGAIIGAGSVVTRDVRPLTVVAGNPAQVVRKLLEEERK